jgi:glutaredoxin-related protein
LALYCIHVGFFSVDDSEIIKVILTRLTKHSTFPNIILRGVSLGGSDTIQTMHEQDQLKQLLEKNGIKVRERAQNDE